MKKKIVVGSVFVLFSIFQISILPAIFPPAWAPNLVLVFLVYLTAGRSFSQNWKIAFFSGFILDIFRFFPPGISSASFVFVSFILSSYSKRFLVSGENGVFLNRLGTIILASFSNYLFLFFASFFFERTVGLELDLFSSRFFEMGNLGKAVFLDMLFFSLVFWPLEKIRQTIGFYERDTFKKTRFLK